MVPGISCVESKNWGREWDVLLYRVIVIRERCNIQNAVFCEFWKGITPCMFMSGTKMSIVFGTGRSMNYFARNHAK